MILGCLCGGLIEFAILLVSIIVPFLSVGLYNAKLLTTSRKHKSCPCDCHEGE